MKKTRWILCWILYAIITLGAFSSLIKLLPNYTTLEPLDIDYYATIYILLVSLPILFSIILKLNEITFACSNCDASILKDKKAIDQKSGEIIFIVLATIISVISYLLLGWLFDLLLLSCPSLYLFAFLSIFIFIIFYQVKKIVWTLKNKDVDNKD